MPFYDRNSKEIDISTMIGLMGESDYVSVERDTLKTDKGSVLVFTNWTGTKDALFETNVWGSPIDGYFKRSKTELEALVAHKETVELVKETISHDYSSNE